MIKFLNFVILQFLFCRIVVHGGEIEKEQHQLHQLINFRFPGEYPKKFEQHTWWSFTWFVIPFTGWFNDYIWIGKKHKVKLYHSCYEFKK
jgi:hypothetical protein